MDILFVGLALLLVWYVLKTALKHGKGSMYSDFAKEQARNKAHKEERLRMKAGNGKADTSAKDKGQH